MAEIFNVGDRVQAVDELGRWTNGRVTKLPEDQDDQDPDQECERYQYPVHFQGYPDDTDSVRVSGDQIQQPVLPYEQQHTVQVKRNASTNWAFSPNLVITNFMQCFLYGPIG